MKKKTVKKSTVRTKRKAEAVEKKPTALPERKINARIAHFFAITSFFAALALFMGEEGASAYYTTILPPALHPSTGSQHPPLCGDAAFELPYAQPLFFARGPLLHGEHLGGLR